MSRLQCTKRTSACSVVGWVFGSFHYTITVRPVVRGDPAVVLYSPFRKGCGRNARVPAGIFAITVNDRMFPFLLCTYCEPLVDGQLFRVETSASLGDVFRLNKVAERFNDIRRFDCCQCRQLTFRCRLQR